MSENYASKTWVSGIEQFIVLNEILHYLFIRIVWNPAENNFIFAVRVRVCCSVTSGTRTYVKLFTKLSDRVIGQRVERLRENSLKTYAE